MDIHKACVSMGFSPALSVRWPGTPVSTCCQRCTTTSLEACVEPVMSWQWHSLPVAALIRLLQRLMITSAFAPSPTRPEPMTMAERFIQTLFRQWAYAYRYCASDHCIDELAPWDAARQLPSPLLCRQTQPPACASSLKATSR